MSVEKQCSRRKTKEEFCFACGTQQPCFDGCIAFKAYFKIPLSEEQKNILRTRELIEAIDFDTNEKLKSMMGDSSIG